ncbi:hypothetical protein NBCG_00187 [Nocardioidaceae bacterium Broad-1]|nr:hypothetical protein NBCG_00187 [Nocardioidaceae bacterium Broad-1]
MSTHPGLAAHGGLAVAGLDAEAEAVYGAVLAAGAIEDAEVARTLGISTDAAARTLDELRAAGLAIMVPCRLHDIISFNS